MESKAGGFCRDMKLLTFCFESKIRCMNMRIWAGQVSIMTDWIPPDIEII